MNKKEIIRKLELRRKQLFKSYDGHYTDTIHWKDWNDPIDGIDYALELLR